tara:strand:+ start:68 stop:607 length:540 start_codon:yes stop_codon:yes gene_type:complete
LSKLFSKKFKKFKIDLEIKIYKYKMSITYNVVVINNEDNELKEKYVKHNANYKTDVGLDIFIPDKIVVPANATSFKIGTGIKASAFVNNKKCSYMIFPRSSMGSKTPLRLCNSIGLVDPEYTGETFLIVDNMSDKVYVIEKYDRLAQFVGPSHENPNVIVVDKLENTERSENGLGSTGR